MLWGLFWFSINLLVLAAIGIIIFIISVVLKDYINNETPKEIAERRKKDPFYKMSEDEIEKLAEKGNVNAMYKLYCDDAKQGYIYSGFFWLVAAAERGHPRSCYLATRYFLDGGLQFTDGTFHPFEEYTLDDGVYCRFGSFGVYPSKATLINWLQNATNHGIQVEQLLWDRVSYYNKDEINKLVQSYY